MKKLRAKLKKQGGFTLIEMLIVVAIIAILIAISIPLINSALERARDATDQANERAAKAEVLLYAMGMAQDKWAEVSNSNVTYYDAQNGTVQKDKTGITGYGKCSGQSDCYQTGTPSDHTDMIIKATYEPTDGSVAIEWVALTP